MPHHHDPPPHACPANRIRPTWTPDRRRETPRRRPQPCPNRWLEPTDPPTANQ